MSKLRNFNLPPEAADFVLVAPKVSQQITSLSPRQQDRLEAQGRFPRSVKLGTGPNGRKGRLLAEILDWNRARIAERDGGAAA
jgi:predicted DNA-binding transcriptional regulator AlpA